MKFKLIGTILCPPTADRLAICPAALTVSIMGFTIFPTVTSTLVKPEDIYYLINHSFGQGINFIQVNDNNDRAQESIIGIAIEPFRNNIVLSVEYHIHATPDLTKKALQSSCARLKTHYLDLCFIGGITDEACLNANLRMLRELLERKLILGIGLVNISPELIERAQAICPITAIRITYSLWNRSPDAAVLIDSCKRLGIACIVHEPTHWHIIKDAAATEKARTAFDGLKTLASAKGATSIQIELAWLRQQGCIVFPEATTPDHLVESINSLSLVLTDEDLALLDMLFPIIGLKDSSAAGSQSLPLGEATAVRTAILNKAALASELDKKP